MIPVLDFTECEFVRSLIVHISKSSYLVCTRHCANGLASPAAISPSRINLFIMLVVARVFLLLSAQALIRVEYDLRFAESRATRALHSPSRGQPSGNISGFWT
jgi:hypothetical protein